ncbi:MAG: type II toxin-antitoxin system mRNA interferase toxin, RelE/StbE family [Candidatus Paceibacterota bacterium]|jgi:YafQ family addiction module toxin component
MLYSFSLEFQKILKKLSKKDKIAVKQIEDQVLKIISNPTVGKPLRNVLKNYRRVHIGSFVLIYKITETEIVFMDYEHHDKVYKKKY